MEAIRELMSPSEPARSQIGFEVPSDARAKAIKGRTLQFRKKR